MVERRGPGLIGTMARTAVISGTATAASRGIANRMDARAQQGAPQREDVPKGEDVLTQLKTLGELKAQGILTEAEFAAQKARILQS